MPSRRRAQQPPRQAVTPPPPAVNRQRRGPMSPSTLATAVGVAHHDRQLAAVRLGASRRLGSQVRAMRPSQALSGEQRQRYLEEAAYYRYLQRDGASGSPESDWYAAEQALENPAPRS